MSNRRRLEVERRRRRGHVRVAIPNMAKLLLALGNGELTGDTARVAAASVISLCPTIGDMTVDQVLAAAAELAAHPVTASHLHDIADLTDLGVDRRDIGAACARALRAVA